MAGHAGRRGAILKGYTNSYQPKRVYWVVMAHEKYHGDAPALVQVSDADVVTWLSTEQVVEQCRKEAFSGPALRLAADEVGISQVPVGNGNLGASSIEGDIQPLARMIGVESNGLHTFYKLYDLSSVPVGGAIWLSGQVDVGVRSQLWMFVRESSSRWMRASIVNARWPMASFVDRLNAALVAAGAIADELGCAER